MKLNWAERWVVNSPIRAMGQWMEFRWLTKTMSLPEGSLVLEVGCGRGAGAKLILKEFQPASLHALDLDIKMVQKAKGFFSPEERQRVSLYVGDVSRLPFKDASLDAVFGFGVLHHVPDWRGALAEIARVLKTEGIYCVEELYPTLYQNVITKRILVHPRQDRFLSHDLREATKAVKLPIRGAIEFKKLGILGVAVKEA
jgi:ubiquinone/menaquinone biosynthesis C-methylase UbiE